MKKFGLALGGGVARGFFHIGVLKYLEEKNIQIDEIAGTSMGAIVGTAWALGYSAEEMFEIFNSIQYSKLVDVSLGTGVMKGKKIMAEFNKYFQGKNFSETKIPLKVVTTNLSNGKKIVLEKGDLIHAVRASMSIPGVFSPHLYRKQWLVDGGISDNLPIRELKNNEVIAVSVIKKLQNFEALSEAKKLKRYEVLRRTIHALLQANEELVLENSTKKIHLVEFTDPKTEYIGFWKLEEIVQEGYETAKRQLAEL